MLSCEEWTWHTLKVSIGNGFDSVYRPGSLIHPALPTALNLPPEGAGLTTAKSFLPTEKAPALHPRTCHPLWAVYLLSVSFCFILKQGFLSFTVCLPISCFTSVTSTELGGKRSITHFSDLGSFHLKCSWCQCNDPYSKPHIKYSRLLVTLLETH